MTLTEIFEKGAGAKINATKTEILCLGCWKHDDLELLPKSCLRKNIKVLGVWFGPEAEDLNGKLITEKNRRHPGKMEKTQPVNARKDFNYQHEDPSSSLPHRSNYGYE